MSIKNKYNLTFYEWSITIIFVFHSLRFNNYITADELADSVEWNRQRVAQNAKGRQPNIQIDSLVLGEISGVPNNTMQLHWLSAHQLPVGELYRAQENQFQNVHERGHPHWPPPSVPQETPAEEVPGVKPVWQPVPNDRRGRHYKIWHNP